MLFESKINDTLIELSIGANGITNEGCNAIAQFLPFNKTLKLLDLSRNSFNDMGFTNFASLIAENQGLEFLDISRNKDITDEDSLITLVESLAKNQCLKTLDLSGI